MLRTTIISSFASPRMAGLIAAKLFPSPRTLVEIGRDCPCDFGNMLAYLNVSETNLAVASSRAERSIAVGWILPNQNNRGTSELLNSPLNTVIKAKVFKQKIMDDT